MEIFEKRFNGIAISLLENKTHELLIDDETINVRQTVYHPGEHCGIMEFTFDIENPVRFRLDVLIPENVVNACVTLNEKVLIGLFSDILPIDCEVPKPSVCNGLVEHEKISTLVPGKFQSINFKWINTDVLKFYLFY